MRDQRRFGRARHWEVYPEHWIVDGFLANAGEDYFSGRVRGRAPDVDVRVYDLAEVDLNENPNLVTEFAKLVDSDDARVVAFSNRWGLLGYNALRLDDGMQFQDRSLLNPEPGEPLSWIRAHARGVRLVLEIHARLSDPDDELERYLRGQFPRTEQTIRGEVISQPSIECGVHWRVEHLAPPTPWGGGSPELDRPLALWALSTIIDSNLSKVVPIVDTRGDEIDSYLAIGSLIEAVYLHLRDLISGPFGDGVRRCEGVRRNLSRR